ncbi:hypothetical protein Val02_79460 [Virgisporangium aliadipatigenens]|uniref:Solute-binding protein family 5 domain-containing protein n=1 Tax=Virgisporangium aliadipatigenens TaxID=741659 RepID=A0A8J3YWC3_9ACTN|nr:ABC transporter family substrate-binding protein [Virgisporangium aliadipatigenens]GIJ51060.1 hypothetical protein Val02_79460 [Virgisporangium aliadipatigenens]
MRTRSKRLGGLVAIAAASVLVISACGTSGGGDKQQSSPGFAACEEKPNECNNGPTKPGGSIVVALEKPIPNFNVLDSEGNVFEAGQIMNATTLTPFTNQPDNSVKWNKNWLAEEPKLLSTTPQTVQYKIRNEAVWDDGTPVSAKDFQWNWKSLNGKDCPKCTPASTSGYELITAVEGSDNDKTVTVKFDKPYPDWKGLFQLFPAHKGAQQGDINTPEGLEKAWEYFKAKPDWTGGPYKVSEYQQDVSVTLVPNPKWYGTKTSLDKITFRIITDQAQQLPAMQNKEIQVMVSQPNKDMVDKVKGMAGVNFNLSKGPTWEHIDINTKNTYLADVALRQAIFTATNRQEIIDKTVGSYFPSAAPLNNHIFMPGAPGYKDVITSTGQGKADVEAAKKILTTAGYKIEGDKLIGKDGQPVPAFRFRYTAGNQGRQQSAELFQAQMKKIGVEIKIEPTTSLGGTTSSGDYDIIIFAWVGTPYVGDSVSIWSTGGGQNYGKYSNTQVDALMKEASQTLDETKMRELFNQADEIMAKEAYVLPLYQKPVFLAVYGDYINIRNNPTNVGPTYNIEEWGLKADS